MKYQVSTAALALMLATGLAVAQDKQPAGQQQDRGAKSEGQASPGADRGQSSGSERRAGTPDGKAAQSDKGGRSAADEKGQSKAGDGKSGNTKAQAQDNRTPTRDRAADADKEPTKRADDAKKGAAKDATADQKSGADKKDQRASDRTDGKASTKQSADEKSNAKDRDRAATGQSTGESGKQATDDRKNGGRAGQADGARTGGDQKSASGSTTTRAQISDQQRERVTTVFREQKPQRASNVNVDIRIGNRLPRNVELRPLPRNVVEIVPEYRSYRYIYVGSNIAIVDPSSYEIVYVIDERGGGDRARSQQAALELSGSDRQLLFRLVDLDRARADVKFRMALGAEVPDRVELYRFPDEVLAQIPRLEPYRFVVVEREILIVDPQDRQIELVVERR